MQGSMYLATAEEILVFGHRRPACFRRNLLVHTPGRSIRYQCWQIWTASVHENRMSSVPLSQALIYLRILSPQAEQEEMVRRARKT